MDNNKKSKRVPSTMESGVSGLQVENGQIKNNDSQHELRGADGLRRIRNMAENDDVAWTAYYVFRYLIKSVVWKAAPSSDQTVDVENAQLLQEIIDDMSRSFSAFIGDVATMVRDGFATFEIVGKIRKGIDLNDVYKSSKFDDGLWGIEKLALRGQMTIKKGRWIGLENGHWTAIEQIPPSGTAIIIPRDKLLNFTTDESESNPEGVSLLRGMYRASRDRRKLENIENIGHSRSTAGTLEIQVPPEIMGENATADEKKMYEEVKRMATLYHRDEQGSFVSPAVFDEEGNQLYKINVLNGGIGGSDISAPIQRKIINQAMTMFVDWLYLGHEGSSGTRQLSSDRMELMIMVINSLLDSVKNTLNSELATKLMRINNRDVSGGVPTFSYSSLRKTDLTMVSEVIRNLTVSGQEFNDIATENKFREELELPLRDENDTNDGLSSDVPNAAGDDNKDITKEGTKSKRPLPINVIKKAKRSRMSM